MPRRKVRTADGAVLDTSTFTAERWVMRFGAVGFVLLLTVVAPVTVRELPQWSWPWATGTIIDVVESGDREGCAFTFWVTVRFAPGEGPYTGQDTDTTVYRCDTRGHPSFQVGRRLRVQYNPARPSETARDGEERIGLGFLTLQCLGAAIGALAYSFRIGAGVERLAGAIPVPTRVAVAGLAWKPGWRHAVAVVVLVADGDRRPAPHYSAFALRRVYAPLGGWWVARGLAPGQPLHLYVTEADRDRIPGQGNPGEVNFGSWTWSPSRASTPFPNPAAGQYLPKPARPRGAVALHTGWSTLWVR